MSQTDLSSLTLEDVKRFEAQYVSTHGTEAWERMGHQKQLWSSEQLADFVVYGIKMALAGPRVEGRFAAVESRLAALEPSAPAASGSKPRAKFVGPWEPHRTYSQNVAVASDRRLYVSLRQTSQPPGTGEDWQLVQDFRGGA